MMNTNELNDTFDNISFPDISTDLINFISQKPKSSPLAVGENNLQSSKNVSFDDSIFLNALPEVDNSLVLHADGNNSSIKKSNENLFNNVDKNNKCFKSNVSIGLFEDDDEENDNNNDDNDFNDGNKLLIVDNHLSAWGLPSEIIKKYEEKNLKLMFEWQVECLNCPNVFNGTKNLVYSAPTSAGKTLVTEILTIKTLIQRNKKVIFILPFVSVVREKMFYFQDILGSSGIRVEGFMGSYSPPNFETVQLAICTIEKANSLINKLLLDNKISQIGAVVIDEMHLLGDPNRGYLLELLLTKLRYISLKDERIKIQILGMSATLPNLKDLANWLDAELYTTNFRPVPLYEQLLIGDEIFNNKFNVVRKLKLLTELETDTDHILQICLETIQEHCSVLIFCPTKSWCENLSQQIAQAFWKLGCGQTDLSKTLRTQLNPQLIVELLGQLKYCPTGLDEFLRKTVSFGVAFHHAGLTMDERDIIESAFRNGVIRVLVATSTLSSGVNLPARRVIIRTPNFHGKPLDILNYRQMIGRAGRMGKDTKGESILICQKNDQSMAKNLISSHLEPIESCLEGAGKLKRAILEIIASQTAKTPDELQLFANCTLLKTQKYDLTIENSLEFLINNEFIRLQKIDNDFQYQATSLGKACLSSSIPPEDGLALFSELEKARQCFVLDTELHLIYLVTPYNACQQWGNIDWMFYLNLWEKLPLTMKKVGDLVGITESYIVSATLGKIQTNTSKLYHKLLIHKRFFIALALQDLVNEKPLIDVCEKFHCNRGMLQSLQLTSSSFAGMVTAFCRQLGWTNVELLISQFQDRLQFGVGRELLDLMKLPILNGKCARILFDGGIETLVELANSDINKIEDVLHKAVPFETEKLRDGESEQAFRERNKFRNIWITGKEGLTEREAADLLLNNARNYLKLELGLKTAQWKNENDNNTLKIPFSITNDSISQTDLLLDESQSLFSPFNDKVKNNINNNNDVDYQNGYFSHCSSVYSLDALYSSEYDLNENHKRYRTDNNLFYTNSSPMKKYKINNYPEDKFDIVNVTFNEHLFQVFINELRDRPMISLSISCRGNVIEQTKTIPFYNRLKIEGFAISWGFYIIYYIKYPSQQQVDTLRNVLDNNNLIIKMFDCKEQLKLLKNYFNIELKANFEDPKVGDWLLDPEGKEKNLQAMVVTYLPEFTKITELCGACKGLGSIAIDVDSDVDAKIRSSVEVLSTWYLTDTIKSLLHKQNLKLLKVFLTEMQCIKILSIMETIGLGASRLILENLIEILNQHTINLENKAYALAGRRFSFTSAKEVARILGLTGRKISTKKQVLEHLTNPIAELVLQWRKINGTLTKTLQPLLIKINNNRIFGNYIFHTATGRYSMHEPNLQNIAKRFEIVNPFNFEKIKINCRDAFIPKQEYIFLSADYSQLELRLLAHLSQDKILCKIMRKDGDIFRLIASKWNNTKQGLINDDLRQKTKQLCYGIIYGMGNKALAEHLSIREDEALEIVESFKNSYPGLKKFTIQILEDCRKNGYVTTIGGRRRYLPLINDKNTVLRSQAERQAINTTIQGSAADIVKKAMVKLELTFKNFKQKPNLVLHLHDELLYEVPIKTLRQVAMILKFEMEECVQLSIPFPIKLKSGPSWGELTELQL